MLLILLMLMLKHLKRQCLGKLESTMLALEWVGNQFPCSLSRFSLILCSQEFFFFLSGRSVNEFVHACKKATGVDIKVDYLPRRPGDYAEVFSDPSKINRELNWTAQYTDLQKSLQVAWRWQKSHQNGYGSPLVMAS